MTLKNTLITLLALLLVNCSEKNDLKEILQVEYAGKLISSGKNRPQINLRKDNLRDLIILLHHRVQINDIKSYFAWDDEELNKRLNLLIENDFIKYHESEIYLPTSMVIDQAQGEILQQQTKSIAGPISEIIIKRMPEIKKYYYELEFFEGITFEEASFLVISDVLLDNWQINNVEEIFLKTDRTDRHGMNYYHSFQEKTKKNDKESFGIYGNQMWGYGKFQIGIYGNKRSTSVNFLTLKKKDFIDMFDMPETTSVYDFKGSLLETIVHYSESSDHLMDATHKEGFNRIDLMDEDKLKIPVMNRRDYTALSELSLLVTEDLVNVLEQNRDILHANYLNSIYSNEITFEEYFIWWYHFLYSEVTDILVEKGFIKIPSSGITTYVINWL